MFLALNPTTRSSDSPSSLGALGLEVAVPKKSKPSDPTIIDSFFPLTSTSMEVLVAKSGPVATTVLQIKGEVGASSGKRKGFKM